MEKEQIQSVIKVFPCLNEISWDDWNEKGLTLTHLPVNLIVPEGQVLENASFVVQGTIRIFRLSASGREITLYRVNTGECCPLMAANILGETTYEGTSCVEEPTTALMIPADIFRTWTGKYKDFREFVFSVMTHRIITMSTLIDNVAFKSIRTRISEYLLEKIPVGDDSLSITHDRLAVELGTTREVISRALKAMEKEGLIQLARGGIHHIDRARLMKPEM